MWIIRVKYLYSNQLGQTMLYGPFEHKSDAALYAYEFSDISERIWLEYVNPVKEQ